MTLPLPLHLFVHLSFAVLVGYAIGREHGRLWIGIIAGVIGGFLIDLDHILEYLFVFGPHFNFTYFFEGRQFLTSGLIRTIFHGWEYVVLILFVAWLLRGRKAVYVFLLALGLGVFIHLVSDCVINQYPPQNYSIIYRYSKGFSARALLSPEQYQKYLDERQYFGM